jgi:DNA-binding transcriptional ArsR family regulator
MANEMIARGLKALSDPTRLHIVEFLSRCCCGQAAVRKDGGVEGPTAGEVCCHITGSAKINSTVSHHLHELKSAGIVNLRRKGKATLCTINSEGLVDLSRYLAVLAEGTVAADCCEGECYVTE